MSYEPGRVLARDEARRPFITWVAFAEHKGDDGPIEMYAAAYVDGSLLRQDLDSWWFRYDWPEFRKQKLTQATIDRVRACRRPGWPVLPSQEGLL